MKTYLLFFVVLFCLVAFGQDNYDFARKYMNQDQMDSARFYIDQSLIEKPTTEDYFLSGMIHEAEGKGLRALSDYEAVVKTDPDHLEAYFQKGLIYYHSASCEQAIKDFTIVIDRYGRSETRAIYFANDPFGNKGTFITTIQSMLGSVYQYRGLAYKKLGDTSMALRDFNRSFEFDTLADYYINRSQLYTVLDQDKLAVQDLKEAVKLEPKNYLAWYNLAILGDQTPLPAALVSDDEFAPMLNLLGANAYENDEFARAASYFAKAIENNEKDELAYMNRGKSLLKTGAYRQARMDFLKALQLNPGNLKAFYLIGNSFFHEHDYEQAIGFYERYLASDQEHKNVWYNAAMAYLSVKNTERGCECLEQSKRLGMGQAQGSLKKHCKSP